MTEHTREEQVTKLVTYQTECDGCEKIEKGYRPKGWHQFDSNHGDWGNDSIESYDYFDVCSWGCYLKVVRRELDDYGEVQNPTLVIDEKDIFFIRSMLEANE